MGDFDFWWSCWGGLGERAAQARRLKGGRFWGARGVFSFVLVFVLVGVVGCERSEPASSLPVTRMQIGGEGFNLEIARSFHEQEVGLMHRDHLDADHGMIFPMPDDTVREFWNHDVHFPLDVIFLNAAGDIVSIVRLETFSDKDVSSGVPAVYAIELNAGTAARLGLKVGQHLDVPREAMGSGVK